MSAGYWVFARGGLLDSRATESPPLLHVVNLPGQNAELGGGTLCGASRFQDGDAGGSWRPTASDCVEREDAGVGAGSDGVQVCPRCADELLRRCNDALLVSVVA